MLLGLFWLKVRCCGPACNPNHGTQTHGTPRSCFCHMITAYIPRIVELSTAVIFKMLLRVILRKSERKARWLGNGYAGSETGVELPAGPPEDFQMMRILLGQDADISKKAADASPVWDKDSHRTSQWGTSYAEYLHTGRFLPLHSPDRPASRLSLNKSDSCNLETDWIVKNK